MKKNLKRSVFIILLFLMVGCGALGGNNDNLTPIFVTATPRIIVVSETPLPGPTSVIAPTLPSDATEAALDFDTPDTPTPRPTQITLTPTFTPTPTNTPPTEGAPRFVPVGGGANAVSFGGDAVGACTTPPTGGFATIYNSDPNIPSQLSCPVSGAATVSSAYQTFQNGVMIWVSSVGAGGQSAIYVLYNNSTYQRFADTWVEGVDPSSTGLQAPSPDLREPIRGFGKVWRQSGGVRDSLGWATSNEQGGTGATQVYERGELVYITQSGQTYILSAGTPGTWTAVSIAY